MVFSIDHYGWGQQGPFPAATAAVREYGQGLEISFEVQEQELRAVHGVHNEMVCEDSCVEFFCSPYPEDARYLNIEINPIGTVHFAIGSGRGDRILLPERFIQRLNVRTTIARGNAAHWTVHYRLEDALIAEVYQWGSRQQEFKQDLEQAVWQQSDREGECCPPEASPGISREQLKGNFYKCGDLLKNPHWGSWQPIDSQLPDFHRPEFFRKLLL